MKLAKKALKLADEFRVKHADSFRLKDYDPADTHGLHSKEKANELLQHSAPVLQELRKNFTRRTSGRSC